MTITVGDTVTWTPPSGRRSREGKVVWVGDTNARILRQETTGNGIVRTRTYTLRLSKLTRKDAP